MGEVWEATDTKLNRQVALKILPEAFAADPRLVEWPGPRRSDPAFLPRSSAPLPGSGN